MFGGKAGSVEQVNSIQAKNIINALPQNVK
jgi:hypothetical protein